MTNQAPTANGSSDSAASSSRPLRHERVGIVATRAASDPTGIGSYTRNLVRALQSRLEDLWIIGAPKSASLSSDRVMSLPDFLSVGYRSKLLAPWHLRSFRFSLLHFMTESELFFTRPGRAKMVVTIHGCASSSLPPELHQQLPRRARLKYRSLLKRVEAIITISQSSKREIIETFHVTPEKVTVIPNGIADPFRLSALAQEPRARPSSERPFLLSVCATIPKKNIIGILEALSMLKSSGIPLRLIHVGPRDWGYETIRRQVELLGLQRNVEFRGVVSTDKLIEYYTNAAALVFPSFHEGFGLPILEAMACGCPVITSDRSAMPEVAGDAALFVDPRDSGQIAESVRQVLTDEPLRQKLINNGRQRAAGFTWERAADKTIDVYKNVLGSRL